ncbi:fumarylacetoacetate hydrolase family protein [Sphaerisporangium sp. NPDC051011]|uniref:fumarylacetoacetate hydrolase family protein n=1 Tax=Sphaerisporangium sp. NPDC051011 TaxID=3155792 RepID=UPI0033ECB0E1
MRFATVSLPDATTTAAVLDGSEWRALPAADLSELIRKVALAEAPELAGQALDEAKPTQLLHTPRKVICCGLNYSEHIRETGRDLPEYPTLFAKFADTLTGPDADISVPDGLQVDWEAELAVVVGTTLHRATRDEALAAIGGYTVANDISMRSWQYRSLEWLQGKAWDGTTPIGPVLVTPDEIDPAAGLDITCRVNGEVVQEDNTGTLVFDSADLLAYVSTFTRLMPGDVILTGTPGGVGVARTPQTFLADGDVVETAIAGIGRLRNVIRVHP